MPFLKAAVVGAAASVSLTLLIISTAYARAADAAPQLFDIRPQGLAAALSEFARQSHEELLFAPEVVAQKGSHGVRGTMEPLAALKILLKDSGLSYSTTPAGAILVWSAGSTNVAGIASATTSAAGQSDDSSARSGLQLAQVDQGQTPSPSTVEGHDEQASERKRVKLEEVVVTGSRIPTAAGQQALPVSTYSREQIETSGQTTVADFLNTLPDASINSVEGDLQSFLGRTTVQLHGLPAGTTLTLLDGRPIESSVYGYFDLGAIPVAAIERIDVLPVGSSAVYGSDALAGAVNMILRKDFDALEVDAKYGRATGTGEDDFSLAWGKTWDRGSVSLVASYQGRSELLGSERSITSTTDVPADAASFNLFDLCSPGTVYSLNGQPLPGLGTATQAAIPSNISGKPTIQAFQATAGKTNLCNVLLTNSLIPTTHRQGALLSGHYEIGGSADLFTEVLLSHEFQDNVVGDAIDLIGGSFGYTTIGAGNPYNPFGEEVGVSYSYRSMAAAYDNWQTFVRPLVGIRGSLVFDWKYEVTTTFSQDEAHDQYTSINQTALQGALNSTSPATALNPFTSGAPGSPQLLGSLLDDYADSYKNQLTSTQAIVHGPLLTLPSGAVQAVVGLQYDHERLYDALDDSYAAPSSLSLARHSYAVFAEERVPILAANARPESGERLALSFAERYDKYSDFGGKTTGQAGLEWRPSSPLLLRAAYATSYKAPELQQIAGGVTGTFQGDITDPYRGNSTYPAPTEQGSNANLQPETGESRVLGIVYDSNEHRGLKASLSYFAIDITNYISVLSPQVLIDNPTLFPGLVTRAPPTPQEQQLGYLGVITNIRDIYLNYGDIRVAGLDFDVSRRLTTSIGDFMPSLALTDMVRYRTALTPGAPDVSYLSQATLLGPGFAPRWKGTVALGWQRGPLITNLTGRYIGPYRDYQELAPNTNELGNTWYCDFNLRYDLSKGVGGTDRWYHNSFVEVGAVNLLNNLPKFSYSGADYDYAESDIRGRFVYARFGLRL
jgi:iron complex outermembrane receptor protein